MRALFLFLLAGLLPAQMIYEIHRTSTPIQIDAELDEEAWRRAPSMGDFHFNWWTDGEQEQTIAKMLWDDNNLYVSWFCKDRHISASVTQRHGPVSKDDCVEIFLSPNPAKVTNYYTFEINAIGTMLNRNRTDWWKGPPTWEPEGVRYRTTFHGLPKKDEAADDDRWIVEMAIPLKNFARDAAHMPPKAGDQWRLNLHRLGGITNPQYSSWSPIATEKPAFHTPTAFGTVRFVATDVRNARRGLTPDPKMISDGRALYNRTCTTCHGVDAAAGDRAPALAGERRFLRRSERDLFDAIRKGIPGTAMPATNLPDADVWKVVAYIRSLRATAFDDVVAGNVTAGERVFWEKGRCSECHMLRGRGGLVGPDLSDIGGSRTLAALREVLTKPLPNVPRGYQPVRITTNKGKVIEGILKNENNFSLQLLDRDSRLHLLLRDEVREVTYEPRSVMPRDFDRTLSASELQDLLAFLSRQAVRKEETAE